MFILLNFKLIFGLGENTSFPRNLESQFLFIVSYAGSPVHWVWCFNYSHLSFCRTSAMFYQVAQTTVTFMELQVL